MGETLIDIRNLTVDFDAGQRVVRALHGVDLAIAGGEAVGLVGESGSGKSVTWLAALGLLGARARIGEQLQAEANFFYRRGVLSLFEGDIPTAKQRFLQSTRKSPREWELNDVIHPDAQRYLKLIEMAEKKATP